MELFGIACPFYRAGDPGTEYELESGEWERFAPTAFDRALRRSNVRCDLLHNEIIRLGYTGDGTVRLWADADGLHFAVDLARGGDGLYVAGLVADGMLRGASVSFYPRESRRFTDGGRRVVEHLDVDLVAFSPVRTPAYTATSVAVRGVTLQPIEGAQLDG